MKNMWRSRGLNSRPSGSEVRHAARSGRWARQDTKTALSIRADMSRSTTESLLCVFFWVVEDPRFLHVDSEDSDQTGLIRVFAGRTCHFIGFVMLWLICANTDQ